MFNEIEFENWLNNQISKKTGKKLSESSISKYISSIRQISNFLGNDLFDENDFKSLENEIKKYFHDKSNEEKNSRGNRQWSSASNNLKKFYKYIENNSFSSSKNSISKEYNKESEEGNVIYKMHKKRERDGKLPKRKKEEVYNKLGKLSCEVCDFDFYKKYGKRGYKFIECHHNIPISKMKEGDVTKINDLSLVCSNCHRMIHKATPWWTIEKLKKELQH